MNVWQNEKNFILLLERKKEILLSHIIQIESKLLTIEKEIKDYQEEQAYINQQIKLLTPSGILARADIYRGIRRQGALLAHLQIVSHKITQLEEEKIRYQDGLKESNIVMSQLNKRNYKMTKYLQRLKRIENRRRDNNSENEIQEQAVYDRKKL
ncbi:type III secretion system protein [Citrobacter sp. JGM124]|uniref:type III secretion system protein n=1 Tax=Citrobacter sp. JGM124 TaxID=2799789 RepID=UPI001BAE53C7|nr:type III secretion system protein [Citrobacter sp. JGM124]MBS0846922.1 type III secretion system protein [Citrobacter sp. JGM124]